VTTEKVLSPAPGAAATTPRGRRGFSPAMILLAAAALIAALALIRVITGADDLTSSGATRAALQSAIPIGLAGLGGLWAERSGVINIGLEGMMILGTFFGAWGALEFGVWGGVVAGLIGGALGGLLHAIATVTFGVDHIVSGVAITILAGGVARYLSGRTFAEMAGGGITQSPGVPQPPRFDVPGVSALRPVEEKGWFLVSDLAGVVRGALTDISTLTVLAVLLVPLTFFVLWRTAFGLRLRSCGENPKAAETLGVNVYLYKYIAVVVSGALAGLGGAFLSMVAANIYREGQTNGRGFIGLAAMIFGNWRPGGLAGGAMLFGYTDALQLRRGSESVHALLLLIGVLLMAMAIWQVSRGSRLAASITAVVGALALLWYFGSDAVPEQFVAFAPHLTTLVVLALASQRLRPPAADGVRYRRGTD
jgi:ABC-type uncharacterized transport system permease subunit